MLRILALAFVACVVSADDDPCDMACTAQYSPVCGSDGVTYASQCSMESSACSRGITLQKVSDGECEGDSEPQDCLRPCPLDFNPVCASNRQTYPNECAMEVAACKSQTTLRVVLRSSCPTPRFGRCDRRCRRIYRPVCGSDGTTYSNQCMMEVQACLRGTDITVASTGRCE